MLAVWCCFCYLYRNFKKARGCIHGVCAHLTAKVYWLKFEKMAGINTKKQSLDKSKRIRETLQVRFFKMSAIFNPLSLTGTRLSLLGGTWWRHHTRTAIFPRRSSVTITGMVTWKVNKSHDNTKLHPFLLQI